jgi:hypothetical protein
MQERMQQEHDEMLATLNLANSALMRIFGIGEGEECVDCGRNLLECEQDKADCGQMNE